MVHPRRGFRIARRMARRHPNRQTVKLYDYVGRNVLAPAIKEAFWTGVSERSLAIIANIEGETRTWVLPVSWIPQGVTVVAQYRIQDADGVWWQIISANLRSAEHTWHCVCSKHQEHGLSNLP